MTRWIMLSGLALVGGCTSFPNLTGKEEPTEQVANHPFSGDAPRPARTKVSYAPAAQEVAFRVDRVGQALVAANPQAGVRPIFVTVGAPTPEIFHVGTSTLYITDGVVKQCPTDRELSAVLANELGKMISEREAAASRKQRDPDGMPPPSLPIGMNGYDIDNDPSRVFEMSKYESRHPRQRKIVPPPDPAVIARSLLEKAGHLPSDLDAVRPILQAADRNLALEQQLKGMPPTGWTP